MVISIHQPNFFPWIGFFDKLNRADIFVVLDDVQIQKTGSSWINRVKLQVADESKWVTAPIDRNYSGTIAINEAIFRPNDGWRRKMLATLQMNYKKTPFYIETYPFWENLILTEDDNVAFYNSYAITEIATMLEIDTSKFRHSSQMIHTGTSNELLVSLIKSLGGDTYLCGGGADGYQDNAIFEASGIAVTYQQFRHPVYLQNKSDNFQPGLSIIDAVMHTGWEGTKIMLEQSQTASMLLSDNKSF